MFIIVPSIHPAVSEQQAEVGALLARLKLQSLADGCRHSAQGQFMRNSDCLPEEAAEQAGGAAR